MFRRGIKVVYGLGPAALDELVAIIQLLRAFRQAHFFRNTTCSYEVHLYAYCYVIPIWSLGLSILVFWYFGLLAFGLWAFFDIPVFGSFGLFVFGSFGAFVFCSFGLFAVWLFGLLVFWHFGL